MTISQKLIPRLLARFPDRHLRVHQGTQPAATFPAVHPEVGDLRVDDDGDELTIIVGELTHGHFTPRNYQTPSQEKEEELMERVMEFLDEVFADQIEFWTADRAGGWHARGEEPLGQWPHRRKFVWSGPVTPREK